jgi:hypothetical protein
VSEVFCPRQFMMDGKEKGRGKREMDIVLDRYGSFDFN